MNASEQPHLDFWHPLAAIVAWFVPGLGHWVLGQRRRGVILGVAIGGLWLLGVLVGGVSVLDHREHPTWFAGQMLVSPSVVVDRVIVSRLKPQAGLVPLDGSVPYEPSFGHLKEQGLLLTALAGLLNLLAMVDVLYQDVRRREDDRVGRPAPSDEQLQALE